MPSISSFVALHPESRIPHAAVGVPCGGVITRAPRNAPRKGLFMKRVSVFAAAGVLGCLAIVPVASQAATSATSATSATARTAARTAATTARAAYHGSFGHGTRIAASATGVAGLKQVAPLTSIENAQSPRALTRFKS